MLQFNGETNNQDFVSEIRDRLGISNLHVNKICRALNLALDEYTNLALRVSPQGLNGTTTESTTSNAYIDIEDYLNVERVQRSDVWLEQIHNADDIPSGEGMPTHYFIRGSRMYLYPTPDNSYTYTIWHSVGATHFEPTDTTETAGKTHQEYLILATLMRLMPASNDQAYTAIREQYETAKRETAHALATQYGIVGTMSFDTHVPR